MHQEKNYILAPCLKSIAEGNDVLVYKTLKANGENVQIAYNRRIEHWVISSKNVALIARDENDLKGYKGEGLNDRYGFAKEMAEVWFNKLKTLSNKELD